jgi:hypothetical protein
LGVDNRGNLIYAAGNNLDPLALARALIAAGAVEAMELDINPQWPLFISYLPTGPVELAPGMFYGTDHYFTVNTRDFIAAFQR